jgi:hypothetical protein
VRKHKWRLESKDRNRIGYVVCGNGKTRTFLHRLILDYDGDLMVDHINRNTLDNRKINLRIVQQVVNQQNIAPKKHNIDLRSNGKYRVRIVRFRRTFVFGLYDTKEEAEKIRDDFIQLIEQYEDEFTKLYYDEIQGLSPRERDSGYTFLVNGKTRHSKMFKTIDEFIEFRKDIQEIINRKTA